MYETRFDTDPSTQLLYAHSEDEKGHSGRQLMPEVATVGVPAEEFIIGRILSDVDDYFIQLTQFVPTGDQLIPYFWVECEAAAAVETALRDHPRVAHVRQYDQRAGRTLYQVEWTRPLDALLLVFMQTDVLVNKGEGTADYWEFELLASGRDELAAFQRACAEEDVPVEILQLFRSGPSSTDRMGLTEKQHEMLQLAYERGYFEIPREVTVTELAADFDISPQAASKRLRRGLVNVLGFVLHDP